MSTVTPEPRMPSARGLADPGEVIGRERELAVVEGFLGGLSRPRALLIEGGAGIGKTTVWMEACRLAAAHGATVLTCRPVQAEVSLAFSGLVDLFDWIGDAWLESMPVAQSDALAVALRRRSPDEGLPDPLTVSAGARAALSRMAEAGPVIVAVDDAQWLDASTAGVLAYVVRRLTVERVGLLVARRPSTEDDTIGLAAGDVVPVEVLSLEPLSLSSLHHVIRTHTGHVVPRPMLHRIAERSGGNPFFAIGLASALYEGGSPAHGEPMPAPRTLMELTASRVGRLAVDAREVLLVVACLSAPTDELVERVVERDPGPALDAARSEGILDRPDDTLRFAHPLYAECVLRLSSAAERRRVHGRIALLMTDPEERARHLALTATPPDLATADALDAGATAARHRGALRAASELYAQARRFTPDDDRPAAHRRAFAAAELMILAGDRGTARELLGELVANGETPLRERAMGLFAEILANDGAAPDAIRLLLDARSTVNEPSAAARIELDLAYVSLVTLAITEAAGYGAAAAAFARSADDGPLLAEALAYEGLTRLLAGLDADEDALDEALRLEDATRPPYMGLPASGVVGLVRAFAARHAEARVLLSAAAGGLDALGDDCDLAHVLLWSSWLELRSGRLDEAATLARQAATMAETTGSDLLRSWAIAQAALVEANRGLGMVTDALVAEAIHGGVVHGGVVAVWLAAAQGLARLAEGHPEAAAAAFGTLLGAGVREAITEPVLAFFLPDAAEAFAVVGDIKTAEDLLRPFEAAAGRRNRDWALAAACRSRSAIAVQSGDLAAGAASLGEALRLLETVDMPIERARTLLSLGRLERRLGERRAARRTLEDAERGFEAAGATGWARQARAELGRVPGRRSADATLTPGELRVAELSGSGRTNREVAATLFLSPKTVEANLARVYRKLGITARAELGAWLAGLGSPDDRPPL
jgi:DNA-binding CsgD family transcriptional regulator